MDFYRSILTILAILEYVFCYDIFILKRGNVEKLNLMESLNHMMSRLSCAKSCTSHLMCDGFYYCTEPHCCVTTCMLYTKNMDIGQSSTLITNSQVCHLRFLLYNHVLSGSLKSLQTFENTNRYGYFQGYHK